MTPGCPFCAIARGEAPATIVARRDGGMVIVPLNPVTDGHLLAVPYRHIPHAYADPEATGWLMEWAAEVAAERYNSCNIITSVGSAATQTVPHLHLHIVPRRPDDGLALPWTVRR